jgi:hypothetical protein
MPEVLVFFGAGSSKAFANIPTMQEMVPLFDERLRKENSQITNLYYSVRQLIESCYPDRVDIEAICSVLSGIAEGRTVDDHGFHAAYEARRLLGGRVSGGRQPTEIQDTAKVLLHKLQEFVASSCEIEESFKKNLVALYSKFTSILPPQITYPRPSAGQEIPYCRDHPAYYSPSWAFYTTNYDLCIETVCREARIEVVNGFRYDKGRDRRIFDPETLSRHNSITGKSEDFFKIIKLHGSISWYRLASGLMVDYPEGMPTRDRPQGRLMLYPIEEKAMYEEPYLVLLNCFREDLRKARKWLFIGYRFNDSIFRRMIEYCSESNKSVGVVHPEADEIIRTRLTNVQAPITPFQKKFADDDQLFTEIGNWVRAS